MGHYIGPDRLEKMHVLRVTDILRQVPGLRVTYSPEGEIVTSSRGGGLLSSGSECVNYFLDDMPWNSFTPGDINDFVNGREVVAVEVYQGGIAPAQYLRAGGGDCTTIVLWTRFKVRS